MKWVRAIIKLAPEYLRPIYCTKIIHNAIEWHCESECIRKEKKFIILATTILVCTLYSCTSFISIYFSLFVCLIKTTQLKLLSMILIYFYMTIRFKLIRSMLYLHLTFCRVYNTIYLLKCVFTSVARQKMNCMWRFVS